MKITANVEVSYWKQPAVGRRSSQRSTLAIGKETASQNLFVLLQNSSSLAGVKYKIVDNIQQMFTRCLKDGKATIRFIEPPHDLAIKCDDKLLLRSFLNVLKEGVLNKGEVPHTKLSSLYSTAAIPKKPSVKMLVSKKSEYPYLEGFPRILQELVVSGIELKNIEMRILSLKNLVHLDLSDNLITSVPPALGLMSLATLNLSKNKIGNAPIDWEFLDYEQLARSLRKLNMGFNQIEELPARLANLGELVSLNVEYNNLQKLPNTLALMKKLKFLHMSDNQLQYVPGNVRNMRLEILDVANNTFIFHDEAEISRNVVSLKKSVISLLELSARTVINQRVKYHRLVPKPIAQYLDEAFFCGCRSACFRHVNHCTSSVDLRQVSASVVTTGPRSASVAPTLECFCSWGCLSDRKTGLHTFTKVRRVRPGIREIPVLRLRYFWNEFNLEEMITD